MGFVAVVPVAAKSRVNYANPKYFCRNLALTNSVEEERGNRRKLLNGELCDLCSSPNIIWAIRSWRVRWMELVVCVGEKRINKWFCWTDPKVENHLVDTDVNWSIILK
jgi:hypothetical protein